MWGQPPRLSVERSSTLRCCRVVQTPVRATLPIYPLLAKSARSGAPSVLTGGAYREARARVIKQGRARWQRNYLRAATIGAFGVSVPVGIVVTRAEPFAPGAAAAGAAIKPRDLRTS